ncbi:hypothetical protein Tco_0802243 [Tanacetum coccineum]|uniref:Uncharacterized protein n=1 Tax=Tanacetum coccineum TaxID=301880 RepID=A0ABQ5A2B6_9ASTR
MNKSWMRTSRTKKQYIDEVEAFIKYAVPNLQKMRNIDPRDAEKPLYKGCPDFTKLSAIVKLLNLKGKYGASDKFFTELLGLLKKMLPAGNEMDNKELTVCPTCRISRWKVDNKTHKVYKNIPAKTVNGVVQLQALIDGKKVFVSEAIIRRDLHLEDVEGVECLPNNEIFEELARMGYEKPPPKLTFYKAFFAPQWKFLIHTLIQYLSAKRTAWNEFSSTMASAVICLATGR